MKFTDKFIMNLKPENKIVDIREGDGFGVRVLPSGVKTFFFIYRIDGKRRFLNLGHYDPVFEAIGPDGKKIGSLAYHRNKFVEAKNKVNAGIDPVTEKETEKEERRKAPTVSDLCGEYIKKHAKEKKKSWEEDQRALEVEIIPVWGKRKAQDIRKRDVVLLLESVIERGSPVMSNRLRALVNKMFNFAVDRDILEMNPCSGVKPLCEEKPKERHLSELEIKTLWENLDKTDVIMSEESKRALKLVLVTAQRPGEVSGIHSNEIDGKWWTIPAERSKNGKAHRIYLTPLALELIGPLERIDKKTGKTIIDFKTGEPVLKGYIFESPKGEKPIDEKGLARGLRRNIKGEAYRTDKIKRRKGKDYLRGAYKDKPLPEDPNRLGVDPFTPHDLRRTAATFMAESGVLEEIVDRVLNHSRRGVTWVYNRYPYEKEIQAALELWERKLRSITSGNTIDNVIPIQSGRKTA